MIRRIELLLIPFLFVSLFSFAQSDTHLLDDPAAALFHRSSWAHGYMHGYESGFHSGNLDLHMARVVRDPHTVKEYRQGGHSYRADFGNRPEYESGYGSGFEVGYLDGASGREFRAATEAAMLAAKLDSNLSTGNTKGAPSFDVMMEGGYREGRRRGLSDARANLAGDEAKVECPQFAMAQAACGAYQVGYLWGYSDGTTNQRTDSSTQRASK